MQEFMGKQQREPELCPFLEVLGISDDELHPVKVLEYWGTTRTRHTKDYATQILIKLLVLKGQQLQEVAELETSLAPRSADAGRRQRSCQEKP